MKEERDAGSAKAHRGLVSVPGPANSDTYSISGADLSDEEGGLANGYLDPLVVSCKLLPSPVH